MILACPVCAQTQEPAAIVGAIAVCGYCGASLVVDLTGQATRAKASDTAGLSAADLRTLVHARGAIARPGRRR